jgi:hypothetical protein
MILAACNSNVNGPPPAIDQGTYFRSPLQIVKISPTVSDTTKLILRSNGQFILHNVGQMDVTGNWSMPTFNTIIVGNQSGSYESNKITLGSTVYSR